MTTENKEELVQRAKLAEQVTCCFCLNIEKCQSDLVILHTHLKFFHRVRFMELYQLRISRIQETLVRFSKNFSGLVNIQMIQLISKFRRSDMTIWRAR